MANNVHYPKTKRSDSSINSAAVYSSQSSSFTRRLSRTSSAVNASSSSSCDYVAGPPRTHMLLPSAASQITKARRIRLYRNGDTYYDGMVVVLAPDNYRTFDSLLTFINKSQISDPSVLKKVNTQQRSSLFVFLPRDCMQRAVLAIRIISLCLSVCLSHACAVVIVKPILLIF